MRFSETEHHTAEFRCVYQGSTPLHAAAQNGYLDIVKAISKHLTNLSPKNALGTTSLNLAVENGHLAIVKYFVENLKDINPAGVNFIKTKLPSMMLQKSTNWISSNITLKNFLIQIKIQASTVVT